MEPPAIPGRFIPVGHDDGKTPLVKWGKWKKLPGRRFLERLAGENPTANVGILTELSGLTIVDVDDPSLVDGMRRRFGNTPLMTATPSGGNHLWYQSAGERCRNRLDGLKVDIRGLGGMAVVPPSIRSTGQHAGKVYAFVQGSWNDLCRLPTLKPGALLDHRSAIHEGARDDAMFRFLLRQVPHCDTLDDLLDVARTFNDTCIPPLPDAQVIKTARSAWRYQEEGRNWLGAKARVTFTADDIACLMPNPFAFALLAKLMEMHGGRREPFALDARAMHQDNVMPEWSRNRYMAATKWLVENDALDLVHQGGKRRGDPSLYALLLRSQIRTEYNRTAPPLVSALDC